MGRFYKERDPEVIDGTWESDIKYWLAVKKEILNPTLSDIKKASEMLESGQYPNDIKSFCDTTGWKYRP